MPYSQIVLIVLFSLNTNLFAQNSFEVMCRNQAKEVAAETYKNCMTEHRQTQVNHIRKEYQQKLSDLKSKYDGELKKVAHGQLRSGTEGSSPSVSEMTVQTKSVQSQRSSGARELPEKKISSNTSKTSENHSTTVESTEIVEIPIE